MSTIRVISLFLLILLLSCQESYNKKVEELKLENARLKKELFIKTEKINRLQGLVDRNIKKEISVDCR